MKKILFAAAIFPAALILSACQAPAPTTPPDVPAATQMTLGVVQKELRKGMAQSDVVTALGSPNIVTRDRDDIETWVYDRFQTDTVSSRSSAYGTVLLFGGSSGQSQSRTSQRTLTLIIKFKANVVDSFTYRSSSF